MSNLDCRPLIELAPEQDSAKLTLRVVLGMHMTYTFIQVHPLRYS